MTYNKDDITKKLYVPFDPRYAAEQTSTDANTADDLLGHKTLSITDKIMTLYQQLYERKEINTKLMTDMEEEMLETSSSLYNDRYNPHLGERQRSSLEKRIDLLGKDKRSALVEYWRDCFKIKTYLLNAQELYRDNKSKRDILI